MLRTLSSIFVCLLLAVHGTLATAADSRPNILIVLLDDAGFMDFGAYGSDTRTPTIDALAQRGTAFTRYYTTPLCGPSRASLLTGQDNHLVGAGTLAEVVTEEMSALPAYSMRWADDQQTIASRLKAEGYQTFATGKWGIGSIGTNLPNRFGFDCSWVLDSTGASNYRAKSYLPQYLEVKWFEDGERVDLPADFYSSRNIVDKMIGYIDDADPERPFFGYVAYQALHIPVQAPRRFIDNYNGVFDRGWTALREERLQRAIDLGLVLPTTQLSGGAYNDRDWDSLSEEEQRYWARAMQTNAGMMEAADYHLGRLIAHLEASGQLDNTIVIVTSDNGPEYNTFGKTSSAGSRAFERFWMSLEGWDVEYDNLGQQGSMAAIGHEWASVSAAPFHLFKFNTSEGGLRVPMVIAGPGIENLGFTNAVAQVADITPTVLEAAGIAADGKEFRGRSQIPVLTSQTSSVYGSDDSLVFEVSGNAAVYRDNWKITLTLPPYGDGEWKLYDISTDAGETTDLSAEHPSVKEALIAEYDAYAQRVGVYEMPPGASARTQLARNAAKKFAANYWYVVAGFFALSAVLAYLIFRLLRALVNPRREPVTP